MELSDRPLNFSANSNSMCSTLQDIRDTDLSRTSSYLGIRPRVCVQQLVCEDNILCFFCLKSSLLLLTSLSKMTRKWLPISLHVAVNTLTFNLAGFPQMR